MTALQGCVSLSSVLYRSYFYALVWKFGQVQWHIQFLIDGERQATPQEDLGTLLLFQSSTDQVLSLSLQRTDVVDLWGEIHFHGKRSWRAARRLPICEVVRYLSIAPKGKISTAFWFSHQSRFVTFGPERGTHGVEVLDEDDGVALDERPARRR